VLNRESGRGSHFCCGERVEIRVGVEEKTGQDRRKEEERAELGRKSIKQTSLKPYKLPAKSTGGYFFSDETQRPPKIQILCLETSD
jgi:hypothetical protein